MKKLKNIKIKKIITLTYLCAVIFTAGLLVSCDGENEATQYISITMSKKPEWKFEIAANSLCQRILGLRWKIISFSNSESKFKVAPEKDHPVSDARIYQMTEMFKKDPWVISAEAHYLDPDFILQSENDGSRSIDNSTWHLGPEGINAYKAWEMIEARGKKPGEGVIIGLPDTGYLEHPELFHEDGSTQLRLDLQYNLYDPLNPYDAHDKCDTLCGISVKKTLKMVYVGHGSTTSSLMISPPGRQDGTVGVLHTEGAVQFAEVIPIRITSNVILTNESVLKLAQAIMYSVDNGAKVISISLGGKYQNDDILKKALKEAFNKGVIVVAASGNTIYKMSGIPILNQVAKPASYDETIAVCGSNAYQKPWRDTTRGKEVDICAPAENIRCARAGWVGYTQFENDTDRGEGTSMATALTASVAALWISYHGYENLLAYYNNIPSKIPQAFLHIIKTNGHRRPEGWDTKLYGVGIIDAALVLEAPLPDL